MSNRVLLQFADFERLPDDGRRHELVEGEHVMTPPPRRAHTKTADRLMRALMPYERGRGTVYVLAGFKLGPDTWLRPDVSVVTAEQESRGDPGGYWDNGPLLAVEIVSETSTAREIDRKIRLLLQHGSEEVWVVYPDTRAVWVHRRNETTACCHTGTLRTKLFSDLQLEVSSLFD
jgi:Uma2 family endonuclease